MNLDFSETDINEITYEAFRLTEEKNYDLLVQIFTSHIVPLLHYTLIQLKLPTQDREDIIQDVFIKVMKNTHQFRSEEEKYFETFRAWVVGITQHRAIDIYRMTKRRSFKELSEEDHSIHTQSDFTDVDSHLIKEEERNILYQSLFQVEEKVRDAMLLRMQGLSYSEIAAELQISIPAVKSRIHRGLLKMREMPVEDF